MTTDGPTHALGGPGGPSSACPDVETLADLHAGALDDAEARRLVAHVRRCESCTAVLDALTAVQADLAALPPVPMPAHVAARIDAALAAEAAAATGWSEAATWGSDQTTALPHAPAPPVSATGTGPTQPPRGGPPGFASVPAGGGPVGPPPGVAPGVASLDAARARRTKRVRLLSVAAAGVVLLGGGVVVATQFGGEQTPPSAGGTSAPSDPTPADQSPEPAQPGGTSMRAFDQGTLQANVGDVLILGELDEQGEPVNPDASGDMADRIRRDQCLGSIPNRPTQPVLAIEHATYEDQPAYIFVFESTNPNEVEVVVVSDQCGDGPATVLDRFTTDR